MATLTTGGRSRPSGVSAHLLVGGLCGGLAVLWSFPLVLHLDSHIPGAGAGDNVTFLWNVFWARQAWMAGDLTTQTSLIFFPTGVDLILHTHTLLAGVLASTLLAAVPLVTSQNLILLLWLALNGYAAALLARDVAGSWTAGVVAAAIFGGSPYVMVHLLGHFNLVAPWGIPLFLLCLRRALRDRSRRWGSAAGLFLGLVAYTDYYYLVYAALAAVVLLVVRSCRISVVRRQRPSRRLRRGVYAVGLLIGLAIAFVWATGGATFEVAGLTISMRGTFNLRTAAGVLGVVWLVTRWQVRIGMIRERSEMLADLGPLGAAALCSAALMAPIAAAGARLWLAGDYVAPVGFWQSAPRGLDLAAPALGNALHPLFGSAVQRVLEYLRIDPIEGVGWIGVLPAVLLWSAWRHRTDAWNRDREWWALAAFFGVWALGPFLQLFGANTGVLLPQMLAAHTPLLSNARIPGRAIVMVYLAVAVLVGRRVATWRSRARPPFVLAGVLLLVLADYLAVPFPLYRLDQPAIYQRLADDPRPGAVCELPFGIRDGFGEIGRLDHRTLYYQTIHGRPLVGGFVARLSPRVRDQYTELPVIGSLLKLSDGQRLSVDEQAIGPAVATMALDRLGVRFFVINHATVSPELLAYVEGNLSLVPIARVGERELYRTR